MAPRKKIHRYIKAACLLSVLGVFLLAFFIPTHQAHAADIVGSLVKLGGGAIGYVVYIILLIANTIGGVLIALITYLAGIILQLSTNVVNTLAVQAGFSVTLAVANLGFVLAIIIIAVATILHRETYGIKKTLWKLVVAAILVNFSLIIGGAFISFANTFTNTFMSQLGPTNGNPIGFVEQLSAAFSPQRAFVSDAFKNFSVSPTATSTPTNWKNIIIGTAVGGPIGTLAASVMSGGTSGDDLASILTPLINLALALGFLIVIVITLAVFLFMITVRYITLAILLIIMPLAWLMWLFPKTAHLWSRWWNTFIRWTFFAPIVVFFLWLAMATAQALNGNGPNDLSGINTVYKTQITGMMAPVAQAVGDFIGTIAGTILNGVIVIGFAIGGMIVADKMSITGAAAGISAARAVGNAAKGYAGRQSSKALRSTYQGLGGQKVNKFLQTSRIPGFSAVGRGLATATEKGGKNLVQAAGKEASGKDSERLALELQGLSGLTNKDKQFAYLAELQKRGDLDMVKTVGGKDLGTFMKQNEVAFRQYEQGKLKKDINESIGSNDDMRDSAESFAKGVTGAGATLEAAAKKFAADLSSSAVQKGQIESMFLDPATAASKDKTFGMSGSAYRYTQIELAGAMGKAGSTQTLSSFHSKLAKGGSQAQFDDAMRVKVAQVRTRLGIPPGTLNPADKDRLLDELFSPGNKRWITSQAAQNMGVDPANWGIV